MAEGGEDIEMSEKWPRPNDFSYYDNWESSSLVGALDELKDNESERPKVNAIWKVLNDRGDTNLVSLSETSFTNEGDRGGETVEIRGLQSKQSTRSSGPENIQLSLERRVK